MKRNLGGWTVETFAAQKWLREDGFLAICRRIVVPWGGKSTKIGSAQTLLQPRRFLPPKFLTIAACACLLALPCVAAAAGPPAPKHAPPPHPQPSPTSHHRWQQLTPQQRSHVKQRAREFKNMNPTQRQRVRDAYHYYHSLPAREREHLREQWQQNPHPKRQDQRDSTPAPARSGHGHRSRARISQPLHTPPSLRVTARHPGAPTPLIPEPNPRSKPRQH